MSLAMVSDSIPPMLIGPMLLFTAIFFSEIFYSSYTIRTWTFATIAVSTLFALQNHGVQHPIAAYNIGFFAFWINIVWSAVHLLVYNPKIDHRRIQIVEKGSATKPRKYGWEAFPDFPSRKSGIPEFPVRRFFWTLDLVFNFRGVGWSYRFAQPQETESVMTYPELDALSAKRKGMSLIRAPGGTSAFVSANLGIFAWDYMMLDLCSSLMRLDPYFSGKGDAYMAGLSAVPVVGHVLVTLFRLSVTLATLYAFIDTFFVAVTLLGVGLLGEGVLGTYGEPWMYPRLWNSLSECYTKGLRGFWGSFWHDIFRFGFEKLPQTFCTSLGIKAGAMQPLVNMTLTFFISAVMHACGSYAQPQNTSAWSPFWCFMVQIVGITLQGLLAFGLKTVGVRGKLNQALVFGASFMWWYHTVPLLFDDLAVSGFWKDHLVPVSPIMTLVGLVH